MENPTEAVGLLGIYMFKVEGLGVVMGNDEPEGEMTTTMSLG